MASPTSTNFLTRIHFTNSPIIDAASAATRLDVSRLGNSITRLGANMHSSARHTRGAHGDMHGCSRHDSAMHIAARLVTVLPR